MTIITSMKQHFEVRAIEWGMAGWAVMWGLQCILNPSMFTNETTGAITRQMMYSVQWMGGNSEVLLGLAVLFIGLFRGLALLINGLWTRTPLIRLITSAISAFLLFNIVLGLYNGPPNFGVPTYLSLFFADCFSAYRASRDFKLAQEGQSHLIAKG